MCLEMSSMILNDDDLQRFEQHGASPLPVSSQEGFVNHLGARIWYATFGSGPTVVLLHGGLGNSRDWGNQISQILERGYSVLVIDTRGHGRSSRGNQPFSYELFASDAIVVLDILHIGRAAFVGWSDGACTSLVLARMSPERVKGVFFFACNMDSTGTKPFHNTPIIERCLQRHRLDYQDLASDAAGLAALMDDLAPMQKDQPNFSRHDLESLRIPVTVVQAEHDEFITAEHARYLANTIPQGHLIGLRGVSHFAPLQRPRDFNRSILDFLSKLPA
jgi:pimeloyl-ACP methyl ester carboxylesterase